MPRRAARRPGRVRARLERLLRADPQEPRPLPAAGRHRTGAAVGEPAALARPGGAADRRAAGSTCTTGATGCDIGDRAVAFAGVDDPHLGYDDLDATGGPPDAARPGDRGRPRAVPAGARPVHRRRLAAGAGRAHPRRSAAGARLRCAGHQLRPRAGARPGVCTDTAPAAAPPGCTSRPGSARRRTHRCGSLPAGGDAADAGARGDTRVGTAAGVG